MATVMGGGKRYQDDREDLARFLSDARTVLSVFLELRQYLLPAYLQEPFSEAWEDVDAAILDSISILHGLDPVQARRPIPPSLLIDAEELDRRLEFFGLTGIQLRLKLASFDNTYRQVMVEDPPFMQVMTMPATTEAQRQTKKKKSGLMGWLLEKMNSILGSLARVLPSVDIIKEFKEMAESGYKESQQDMVY